MNFKQMLQKNDMTCARLARKIGVSRAAVASWASGKCSPKVKMIPMLAEILSVDVDVIVRCFIREV